MRIWQKIILGVVVCLTIWSLGVMINNPQAFFQNWFESKVEAQSLQRFQLQEYQWWNRDGKTRTIYGAEVIMVAICDTATGTLLYSDGNRGGIWGVPNGCQKTSR